MWLRPIRYAGSPRTPILRERQLRRYSVIAKARVAQLNGFRTITAAAKVPVTFGKYSYWLEARLLSWWGSSAAQGRERRRFRIPVGAAHRAARGIQVSHTFLQPRRGDPRGRPSMGGGGASGRPRPTGIRILGKRAATWGRPYDVYRNGFVFSVGAGPRPAHQDMHRERWLSKGQARFLNRNGYNFCTPRAQWPGRNLDRHSDFARRKRWKIQQVCVPRNGVRGKRSYGPRRSEAEP